MVKDICWEVSETVIPDLPAWLNIALKSQPHRAQSRRWGPTLLLNRQARALFLFFSAVLSEKLAHGTLLSFTYTPMRSSLETEQEALVLFPKSGCLLRKLGILYLL